MERATGIGGVFVKVAVPKALRAWYRERLGIPERPHERVATAEFGRFGRMMDREGDRIERWKPPEGQ